MEKEHKLICTDQCYEDQFFASLSDARCWLFNHGRLQIGFQKEHREPRDVGHQIDLRSANTFDLADYFDFELLNN